jgi:hypothetical protein
MKKVLLLIIFGLFITMIGSCTYDNYIDDAIINDDFEYVREYFTKYPNRINEPMATDFLSEFGYSNVQPLIHASANFASVEMFDVLIDEFNADINILLDNRLTPLNSACIIGNSTAQKYLLSRGADTGLLNNVKEISYNYEYEKIILDVLLPNGETKDFFYQFNLEVLKFILDNDILQNELQFVSIAFESLMTEAMKDLDVENYPIELEKFDKYKPFALLLIEYDINPDYFLDEDFKKDYEVAIEVIELLKGLANK